MKKIMAISRPETCLAIDDVGVQVPSKSVRDLSISLIEDFTKVLADYMAMQETKKPYLFASNWVIPSDPESDPVVLASRRSTDLDATIVVAYDGIYIDSIESDADLLHIYAAIHYMLTNFCQQRRLDAPSFEGRLSALQMTQINDLMNRNEKLLKADTLNYLVWVGDNPDTMEPLTGTVVKAPTHQETSNRIQLIACITKVDAKKPAMHLKDCYCAETGEKMSFSSDLNLSNIRFLEALHPEWFYGKAPHQVEIEELTCKITGKKSHNIIGLSQPDTGGGDFDGMFELTPG